MSSGGWTRTTDLRLMRPTRTPLLYPAMVHAPTCALMTGGFASAPPIGHPRWRPRPGGSCPVSRHHSYDPPVGHEGVEPSPVPLLKRLPLPLGYWPIYGAAALRVHDLARRATVVREEGLEPPRPLGRCVLSAVRLPFHHSRKRPPRYGSKSPSDTDKAKGEGLEPPLAVLETAVLATALSQHVLARRLLRVTHDRKCLPCQLYRAEVSNLLQVA